MLKGSSRCFLDFRNDLSLFCGAFPANLSLFVAVSWPFSKVIFLR